MADTTAARPAALQRRMAAMKVEQDEEIEMLEDARRRAQSAGESIEAQLDIENTVNKGLRSELRIAEAARDDARRSVDVVDQRSVDLKRDLRSARSELEVPAPLSAPSLGALPRRPMHLSARLPHPTALSAPPQSPFNPPADAAARDQPVATVRGQAAPHNRRATPLCRAARARARRAAAAWPVRVSFLSEFNSCHQPSGCGGIWRRSSGWWRRRRRRWAGRRGRRRRRRLRQRCTTDALHCTWTMRERHSAEPLAAAAARGSLRLGVYF